LAALAHELRNPLAPIRSAVDVLRLSAAGRPEICDMMDRQVNNMVRLIDDLTEVSRITRGVIDLRLDTIELGAAITEALETSAPLIEAAGHQLSVTLPNEALVVEADAVRLAQVFSNLFNNAVKYTDPGGRIVVAARSEDGDAVVTVTDTGIGMPAEQLPKVFDMFVQLDGRNRRAKGGLGIGLTLARRLVEMHRGTLTAASAGPGRGSEFTVRLPLASQEISRAAPSLVGTKSIRSAPRALVVDDNRAAADILGELLKELGADVRVTYDGQAALDSLPAFRPAVVFVDLGMPDMDGFEVARRIRALPDTGGTVLVAITGWGQEKDRRETQATGFQYHLVKPAKIDVLQTVLSSLD
jgi:CheY-like chemotaxis protein